MTTLGDRSKATLRRKYALVGSLLVVALSGVWMTLALAGPGFTGEGNITIPNPTAGTIGGVTENEFVDSCNPEPATQGLDGWVFALPEPLDGLPAIVTGSSAAPYDLDIAFYDVACEFIEQSATAAADEETVVPAGTAFVVINLSLGADVDFVLVIGEGGPGAGASPSGTPTPTPRPTGSPRPSPSPSPNGLESPGVNLTISNQAPARGSRFKALASLDDCRGHAGSKIQLQRKKGNEFPQIRNERLNKSCRASFTLRANFDRATFRAYWRKQDSDHHAGMSEKRTVRTH